MQNSFELALTFAIVLAIIFAVYDLRKQKREQERSNERFAHELKMAELGYVARLVIVQDVKGDYTKTETIWVPRDFAGPVSQYVKHREVKVDCP